ncbi:MAG: MarR family transcriptional regulator, partial [Phenylobacterium zucineum]
IGVQELAHLTSLSKQAASRILVDLAGKGLVEKHAGDIDGRRRSAALTERGLAFEAAIGERLRSQLSRAYRQGGLDGVAGARAILAAMAGGRLRSPAPGGGRP